ncbi:MAG: hypothetical protein K1X94_32190 [Sandaracinaceae bacterium]|nr:hypothetical protein [Sandaracinaceae bacterium]
MCRRITCPTCGKPSYAGCGMHIEAVLGDVPKEERCKCREAASQGLPGLGGDAKKPPPRW